MITQYLPIILVSGLLAFLSTPLTRWLAHRLGMVAQPGPRKVHRWPVPLLGGLAMYLALVLTVALLGRDLWLNEGLGILGGATLMFITGLWDDRYGMLPGIKLTAQLVATLCLIAVGIQVRLIDLWGVNWLITLVWVIGITNAVNLMDNMDGLAAGVTAIAGVTFFVMAALEGQGLVASLAAALFSAALGFLFYNSAPAISFMGDAGALMLGFLLATLGIKLKFLHYSLGSTWMAPIVVLGVLIFDSTLVILSRRRRGRPISQGGSDHTSHRLVQIGLNQARAVLTLYLVTAALGALAIFITRTPPLTANAIFVALLGVGLITLLVFERIEPKLMGDPPVVLILAGESDWGARVREARQLSQNLTVLLAPCRFGETVQPARAQVAAAITALAEAPESATALIAAGLSEAWWEQIPHLGQVLRLTGTLQLLYPTPLETLPLTPLEGEPDSAALAALRRAKLIVLGPGDPRLNLIPALAAPGLRAALKQTRGDCLWLGSPDQATAPGPWLEQKPTTCDSEQWTQKAQALLLAQAAGQAKIAS